MRRSRMFSPAAAIFVAMMALLPVDAGAATLKLMGWSRVCQLVGEQDWTTQAPTAARTASRFGLTKVDLGFPVDSSPGPLYFLFGDAFPNHDPPSHPTKPPDDAIGWTNRTKAPDSTTCLDLQLAKSGRRGFAHPTVTPPIHQGAFNVPTGGVYMDGKFYGFFWTHHCLLPDRYMTFYPPTPLALPQASAGCPETATSNSLGQGVLAVATPPDIVDFQKVDPPGHPAPLKEMPSGFNYVSAAETQPDNPPNLILPQGGGIAVFGVPRFRNSVPYLAIAPRATFGDPATWFFMLGRIAGNISWMRRGQWESGHSPQFQWVPPPGAEIYESLPSSERCVGEHSVTWNAPLHVWLMLYNCGVFEASSYIEARFAPEPWGPWSSPTVIISAADADVACVLIEVTTGCPGKAPLPNGDPVNPGRFYAPFVMNRFTQDATQPGAGQPKQTTIYWLLSTWNPYTVVVMQSTLALLD
jgi:hypothetical protein